MAAIPGSRQALLASKTIEAEEAGQKFVDIFYDTVDKRRKVENKWANIKWDFQLEPTQEDVYACFAEFRSCQAYILLGHWLSGMVMPTRVLQASWISISPCQGLHIVSVRLTANPFFPVRPQLYSSPAWAWSNLTESHLRRSFHSPFYWPRRETCGK